MTTKRLSRFGIAMCLVAVCLSSCKKDKQETDSDTTSAQDQALASGVENDMTSIADEAGRNHTVTSFKTEETTAILSACATLSFDTLNASNPDTITVNFGNSNCLCNDGRYRRGQLLISYTGKYKDSLTVITVTPQNYFVNDNQIAGTKTITNQGHNAQGHLVYNISTAITITKANGGGTITWQCTRQREWTAGESTLTLNDDMYSITGSASGTTSGGLGFTSIITSPLIRNMAIGCRANFTAGVIDHTPSGKYTRTINYGNGACDNIATVTINGNTFTITLP